MTVKYGVLAAVTGALSTAVAFGGEFDSIPRPFGDMDRQAAVREFQQIHPDAGFHVELDRITRVYGSAFGFGESPEDTAEQFRLGHAKMFGVEASDLDPRSPLFDERHTQGVWFDRDAETYKFTLVYYTQFEGGVPVFRADLRLLVRNDPNHPLVLAASSLRDLGSFTLDRVHAIDFTLVEQAARGAVPDLVNISTPGHVVWAGLDDMVVQPALGIEFIVDNGMQAGLDYVNWLLVIDAETGQILYRENQVYNVDVVGNVRGRVSQGFGADICEEELFEPMENLQVRIIETGAEAITDAYGDFVIPNAGSSPVTVESRLAGIPFNVSNEGGPDSVRTLSVTPPGPANFIFNAFNNQEFPRAEVNGYVEANVVRDWILRANPDYPTISTQTSFGVVTNRNQSCNAFYVGDAIIFFRARGGCSNTANTTIVHHEYGHHLVASGGSGQGQYGEGMGDVMGVIITDQPHLAVGFLNDCDDWLRTADNDRQYPCSGGHTCAPLLSGCVWDTRNGLVVTEPDDYPELLMRLAVDSVLLHRGNRITPQITIDWLTLDDDDGNISNGTPHYGEICTGFGMHGMDCPPLDFIELRPEELAAIRGVHESGELADLFTSNDTRMVFQPGITQDPGEPPIWLQLAGTSTTGAPSELRFILETRVNTPGIIQTIAFFDFDLGEFVEVDMRTTTSTDSIADVQADGDPSRFIDPETFEVKTQLTWDPPPLVIGYPWEVGIDQAVWRIIP